MTVPAERSEHLAAGVCMQCLPCNSSPETACHLWKCLVQSHECCLARQHLHTWLSTEVGPRASRVQGQLWDSVVLEKWLLAIVTPSLRAVHMGLAGPHDMGTEFVRQVLSELLAMLGLESASSRPTQGQGAVWHGCCENFNCRGELQAVARAAVN